MQKTNNPQLTKYAKRLRTGMTSEERKLWYRFLRRLNVTVNRQKVLGKYILDFYCAAAKIAIEIDGSQHYEEISRAKDIERDAYLKEMGIKVLRYSNRDINLLFDEVCESIYNALSEVIDVCFKE